MSQSTDLKVTSIGTSGKAVEVTCQAFTCEYPKENWAIAACTVTPDAPHTPLEVAAIVFDLPDDTEWAGTIQDFMAIRNIAKNALETLKGCDNRFENPIPECMEELTSLLSHFK